MSGGSYVAASSVDEAVRAMAEGARPVAGGTDLVVGARQGKQALPGALVGIHRIEALRGIEGRGGGVRLGALATHAELVDHPVIREHFTGIADAAAIVGSRATRANGTIGGNVMNASPAMDTGAPLICLGAVAVLQGPGGTREVPVAELFAGPGRTTAGADELLVAIDLPAPAPGTGSAYVRLEYRRQMEIAIVGAGAAVTLTDGRVSAARVAITALAPTIHLVPEAAAALMGTSADRAAAGRAGDAAAAAAAPISDVRGSAEYRRAMAAVIARRAVEAAVARARGETVAIPASSSTYGAS
jgi:CO/xanthine dehydrogenase FAD-binding subunit